MSEYIISKKLLEDLRDIWIYTLDTWSDLDFLEIPTMMKK
jgi:hypothetical protein